jgi:hypothetical protein
VAARVHPWSRTVTRQRTFVILAQMTD